MAKDRCVRNLLDMIFWFIYHWTLRSLKALGDAIIVTFNKSLRNHVYIYLKKYTNLLLGWFSCTLHSQYGRTLINVKRRKITEQCLAGLSKLEWTKIEGLPCYIGCTASCRKTLILKIRRNQHLVGPRQIAWLIHWKVDCCKMLIILIQL